MATKKAKPNGQFYLNAAEASDVMAGLKVTELPGVGRSVSPENFSVLFCL
jgi:nucleotidyltransferase/DNA polymerase involved in DNA repair